MNQATIQSIIQRANRRKIAATDALYEGRMLLEQMKRQARGKPARTPTADAINVINSAYFRSDEALKKPKDKKKSRKKISQKEAGIIWGDPSQLTRLSEFRDVWDDLMGSTASSFVTSFMSEVRQLAQAHSTRVMREKAREGIKNISETTAKAAGTSLVKSLIKHNLRMLSPQMAKGPFPALVSTFIVESVKEFSLLSKGQIADLEIYRSLVIKSVHIVVSWTGAEVGAMITAPLGPTWMFLGGLVGGTLGDMGSDYVVTVILLNLNHTQPSSLVRSQACYP